jgi:hypothetical protein
MREWRRHARGLRWQKRLARAPYYRLALWAVWALALAALVLAMVIKSRQVGLP